MSDFLPILAAYHKILAVCHKILAVYHKILAAYHKVLAVCHKILAHCRHSFVCFFPYFLILKYGLTITRHWLLMTLYKYSLHVQIDALICSS